MQKDYKMFPPSVNWENINWSTRKPQMDFPVQVSLSLFLCMLPCQITVFPISFHSNLFVLLGVGHVSES